MDRLEALINKYSDIQPDRLVTDDFETQSRLEPVNKDQKLRRKKVAREPEMDEDRDMDLAAIRLRETLDPKRFYKKKATEKINPKFQIGTVVSHPVDYYSRAPRRETKPRLVDELIAESKNRGWYHRIKSRKNFKKMLDRKKTYKKTKKDKKSGKSK